jgi:ATP-binding cassette subfamily A (ABC1) protein 3
MDLSVVRCVRVKSTIRHILLNVCLAGAGYHMVIVKEPHCEVATVTALVHSYVPQAVMETNIGAELSYILPTETDNRFQELFTDLETNKSSLGISSYGASVTTMEEVFLR